MRRLLAWLHSLVRLSGQIVTVALLLILVLVGWLGLTTNGLRAATDLADALAGDAFDVEHADGRLLGTMELRGLRIDVPAAQVNIDKLRLDWVPGWIPGGTVFVEEILVDTVRVALRETEADKEPAREATGPLDVLIPFRVVLSELTVRDVQLQRQDEPLPGIDALTLSGWAAGRRVEIESLTVDQPQYGRYRLQAGLLLPKGAIEITDLMLSGAGTLQASARIPIGSDTDLAATLDWQDLHWPAGAPETDRLFASPKGNIQVGGTLTQPEVEGRVAIYPSGLVAVDGAWRGAQGFDAKLEWKGLRDPLNPDKPMWRSHQGLLLVKGKPDDWQANLSADASVAAAGQGATPEMKAIPTQLEASSEGAGKAKQEQPRSSPGMLPVRLEMAAAGNLQSADIKTLSLEALKGRLRGSGQLRWHPSLTGSAQLQMKDLDPSALAPDYPASITGRANADFAMQNGEAQADFKLEIADSQLRGHDLQLSMAGDVAGPAVTLARINLRSGTSRLEGAGQVTPPFDFTATLQSSNLSELAPGIAGEAGLGLVLKGPMEGLRARLKGQMRDLAAADLRVAEVDVDADVTLNGPMRARLNVAGVSSARNSENLLSKAVVSLDGRVENHRLEVEAETSQVVLQTALSGGADLDRQRWDGALESLTVNPSAIGLAPWALREPVALSASAEQAELGRLCLDSENDSALCMTGDWQKGDLRADLDLQAFRLTTLAPFLPPGMTIEGGVSGNAQVALIDGTFQTLDSGFEIGEGAVTMPDQPTLAFGPGALNTTLDDEGRVAAKLGLPLAAGAVNAEARFAPKPDGALDGAVNLAIPSLDFLPLFTPEVTEASGSLNARVDLAGTVTAPDWQLEARLDEGTLALFTPGLTLEQITATVRTTENQRLALSMRAESGGGTVSAEGTAELQAKPLRAEIRVQGKDFQAANLPEAQAWISPDLTVRLEETLRVSGRVDIPRANIEPEKFSASGGVTPSGDQVFVGDDNTVEEKGLPVHAEVTVALGDAVSLSGYGLETRLAGSITVVEAPGKVTRARGALTLEDGLYEAYGQKLDIRRGRIVFAGGPVTSPGLDFEAVRTPDEDVLVGVRVRGSINQPDFQLFSEPPMEQNAQLSWLVLARPPTEIGEGSEESSALAAAALALGLSGGDFLAQRIGSKVGVDEISIGAQDGEDNSEARFTVGKYIGSRLYVSYGVSLFQPGQIFKLRYDLGNGFAIQTETGVESGGDLLYTLERD